MYLAECVYNCMSLHVWLVFPGQQLYQKTLYLQQEYCTIFTFWCGLCSPMLILFLSLTLPRLDQRLLTRETHHREPRSSQGQRDRSGAARRPEHAPLATGGKHRSRAFVSFTPFALILCIVFDIVICCYLLLYIRIVLVFPLISYIAFVTTLYHYLLYKFLCVPHRTLGIWWQ